MNGPLTAGVISWRTLTPLAAALAIVFLGGCAVVFKGTVQRVPVDSDPPGATVLVDGEEVGVTPLVLELSVARRHEIVLRLGGRQQTVIVENAIGDLWLGLDVAVAAAGTVPLIVTLATPCEDPGCGLLTAISFAISLPIALIGTTPIIFDAATGAWNGLEPTSVEVTFP